MTGEVSSVEFLELELSRQWYYGVRHPRGHDPASHSNKLNHSVGETDTL